MENSLFYKRARFFRAGKAFTNYIQGMGFKHRVVDSKKEYFTNSRGLQIKIDYEFKMITLLDEKGNTVKYSSTFTDKEIDKFIKDAVLK